MDPDLKLYVDLYYTDTFCSTRQKMVTVDFTIHLAPTVTSPRHLLTTTTVFARLSGN